MPDPGANLTLQVNVSAGDLAYCERTVPPLVAAHRHEIHEAVAVVDCRRPESTPTLQADTRFPEPEFQARLVQLREICRKWQAAGLFDRIVFLEPEDGSAVLRRLNRKYCGIGTARSHDHWGHAFSAYFAGWECATTRYVVHYDADILLHQQQGYSWTADARARLQADKTLLAASPRIAPPVRKASDAPMVFIQRPGSGWLPSWQLEATPAGWRGAWISTRCHLMDRERLERQLPLRRRHGRWALYRAAALDALLLRSYRSLIWTRPVPVMGLPRFLSRAARKLAATGIPPFPLPPEVLLAEGPIAQGSRCLYLASQRAWFLHPDTKPPLYLELLPVLQAAVKQGRYPAEQEGLSGIQFEAWRSNFSHASLAS